MSDPTTVSTLPTPNAALLREPTVRALALRIANAVAADEADGGCDLSAGLFGPNLSALVAELATGQGGQAPRATAASRAEIESLIGKVADTAFICGANDVGRDPLRYLTLAEKAKAARSELLGVLFDGKPTPQASGCPHCGQPWEEHEAGVPSPYCPVVESSEPAADFPAVDLSVCPKCGGDADNGHSRDVPPAPYYCTKCSEAPT